MSGVSLETVGWGSVLDIDEDNQMSVRVGLEDRELEIVFRTSVERCVPN